MAISTIEKSTAETMDVNINNSSKNRNKQLPNHEQMIGEFLDKAEDIAMATTSVDVGCEYPEDDSDVAFGIDELYEDNPFCPIAIDESLVQEIIANDDRLRREVDEFMDRYSMSTDEDEEFDFSTLDYSTIMGTNE